MCCTFSQTTADHIGDHNWQHSSCGLDTLDRLSCASLCVLAIARVPTATPVVCLGALYIHWAHMHTRTHTQREILTQAAGSSAILCSKMQEKASSHNRSDLGPPFRLCLVHVWLRLRDNARPSLCCRAYIKLAGGGGGCFLSALRETWRKRVFGYSLGIVGFSVNPWRTSRRHITSDTMSSGVNEPNKC